MSDDPCCPVCGGESESCETPHANKRCKSCKHFFVGPDSVPFEKFWEPLRFDHHFESQHPRDDDGTFTELTGTLKRHGEANRKAASEPKLTKEFPDIAISAGIKDWKHAEKKGISELIGNAKEMAADAIRPAASKLRGSPTGKIEYIATELIRRASMLGSAELALRSIVNEYRTKAKAAYGEPGEIEESEAIADALGNFKVPMRQPKQASRISWQDWQSSVHNEHLKFAAEFDESEHPRKDDGEFVAKGAGKGKINEANGGGTPKASKQQPANEEQAMSGTQDTKSIALKAKAGLKSIGVAARIANNSYDRAIGRNKFVVYLADMEKAEAYLKDTFPSLDFVVHADPDETLDAEGREELRKHKEAKAARAKELRDRIRSVMDNKSSAADR